MLGGGVWGVLVRVSHQACKPDPQQNRKTKSQIKQANAQILRKYTFIMVGRGWALSALSSVALHTKFTQSGLTRFIT